METKFNFNSQICTTREQSERLLALGLRKETADMVHYRSSSINKWRILATPWRDNCEGSKWYYPAWSLERLIEMLPLYIPISKDLPTFHHYAYLGLSNLSVDYEWEDYNGASRILKNFYGNGLFAAVVDATEWLIKEGYFNKEYLEE